MHVNMRRRGEDGVLDANDLLTVGAGPALRQLPQ